MMCYVSLYYMYVCMYMYIYASMVHEYMHICKCICKGYRSRAGILVVLESERSEGSKTTNILISRPITVLYLTTLFLQSRRKPQNKDVVFLGAKCILRNF